MRVGRNTHEQPFHIGCESQFEGLGLPIPIAADESAQGIRDLPGLVGRFDVVNIKLDKCGGLTEGKRNQSVKKAVHLLFFRLRLPVSPHLGQSPAGDHGAPSAPLVLCAV
jgi:L-alanine-DL-glutamate epimerase-like enolase superfamily enzyme